MQPDFIVGIGGSAGSLKALKALFEELPARSGLAFVIVCHLLPSANSQLAEILTRHTRMPVQVAASAMPIRANHVYVIPPNADLLIDGEAFKVVLPRTRGNNQVDVFFTSLAAAMGDRAIGIILSGYDGDGTEGCRQIKARRGTTFAQDGAEVSGMPESAEAAGVLDQLLPVERIPEALQRLILAR